MRAAIRPVRCGPVNTAWKPNCRASNVWSARRFSLQVQQTAVVNLQMELGTVTQETTVTAAEELVRTVDASQGEVIEERRVKDLPLNGRDYLQLSLLSEGTLAPPGQGRTATGTNDGVGSRAGGFSAGGQRTTDNNYLLDGFDNNTDDTSFDSNQAEVIKPSVDAIQEFKVQTSAYSAEFGRAAGGVVNLTLKSGTNLFHGTAYDFLRNEKMDARNFFDPARKPPFKRNDYGFTFGGPVKKDKLFFFFAWETLKRTGVLDGEQYDSDSRDENRRLFGALQPHLRSGDL